MNAIKCDRCGATFEPVEGFDKKKWRASLEPFLHLHIHKKHKLLNMDLCPACMADLKHWVEWYKRQNEEDVLKNGKY